MELVSKKKVKRNDAGEESMFVCGGPGQRGTKRGAREKQIHNASPTFKSVKISVNPSAPITGKTE